MLYYLLFNSSFFENTEKEKIIYSFIVGSIIYGILHLFISVIFQNKLIGYFWFFIIIDIIDLFLTINISSTLENFNLKDDTKKKEVRFDLSKNIEYSIEPKKELKKPKNIIDKKNKKLVSQNIKPKKNNNIKITNYDSDKSDDASDLDLDNFENNYF